MKGIPVPEREEDFAADPAELFFDLAFVFAFSRLVAHLIDHPDWAGIGEFALLFTMIWLPWTQFTWSANAVAGNSRPVRLLFLLATAASVPMAAAVTEALAAGGPAFAISLSVILAMGLLTLIAGMADEPGVSSSALRYSVPNWIAIALMIVGAYLGARPRIVVWILAMAVVVVGTIRAGSSEWLVRPGHFAERHGLILIVALGEVIVALATPVVESLDDQAGVPGRTLIALVAAGAFAGLLWWGYFDRPSPALEHRHDGIDGGRGRGRYARDVYTYAHLPLIAGVILAAAALEEITVHPDEALPIAFRLMLAGGLALYLLAVVVAIARAFGVVALERLVAAAVILAVVVASSGLDGVVILIAVDLVLAAMLVAEHRRIEGPILGRPAGT